MNSGDRERSRYWNQAARARIALANGTGTSCTTRGSHFGCWSSADLSSASAIAASWSSVASYWRRASAVETAADPAPACPELHPVSDAAGVNHAHETTEILTVIRRAISEALENMCVRSLDARGAGARREIQIVVIGIVHGCLLDDVFPQFPAGSHRLSSSNRANLLSSDDAMGHTAVLMRVL